MKNKLTGMMMLAVAALGIIGCSDKLADESGGTNGLEGEKGGVYMNVAISLPTASSTRSATDTAGGDTGNDQTNSKQEPTDYEFGYANENEVKTVYLVLATAKDEYITHEQLNNSSTITDDVTERYSFIATQKFDREAINAAYAEGGLLATNKTVHVYAFCNPTAALGNMLDEYKKKVKTGAGWLDEKEKLTETNREANAPIWGTENTNFLMSNASVCTVSFPENVDDWDQYSRESNPFHLSANNNPVRVERTAARFDYRDGSKFTKQYGEYTAYGYKLTTTNDENGKNLVSVALTRMSLVNMSNEYYYLRRVSKDGTWEANTEGKGVCGVETSTNYVVDTDWKVKQFGPDGGGITPQTANTYFNYPLYNSSDGVSYNSPGWDNYLISKVLEGKDDTWKGSEDKRYHIWRYVTENTIPGSENQTHIQSVGVVFKARIITGSDVAATVETSEDTPYLSEYTQGILTEASKAKDEQTKTREEYPELYNFNNLFYAGFKDLVNCAAKETTSSPLYIAVRNILSHWYCIGDSKNYIYQASEPTVEEGEEEVEYTQLTVAVCDDILNNEGGKDYKGYSIDFINSDGSVSVITGNLQKLIVDQKITIYTAEEDPDFGVGYYCYYFYWNRHNDNGKASDMGPMEFATVRNNVYKLSVTGIKKLGHPTTPSNDPEPVGPGDPDESDDIYMDVTVEVLPWVVRVNDIEF